MINRKKDTSRHEVFPEDCLFWLLHPRTVICIASSAETARKRFGAAEARIDADRFGQQLGRSEANTNKLVEVHITHLRIHHDHDDSFNNDDCPTADDDTDDADDIEESIARHPSNRQSSSGNRKQ